MKRLFFLLALAVGCAAADGAPPGKPTLDVVAAGDTAKIFVSWTAATKATGALLTVNVSQSNGTWTALPINQAVSAGGTAQVLTSSLTADSGLFQACMKSTTATATSAQGCSNSRQWLRKLQPPVVNIDSLVGLLVAPNTFSLAVGNSAQGCAFYQFASGHVAMRTQDALGCTIEYGKFTVFQKAVTNTEQVWTDNRCQRWTSSNPLVATVTTEAGCTGSALGSIWMGVPIEALRVT